jgi:tetratricopeptide (TPR) repeat protein
MVLVRIELFGGVSLTREGKRVSRFRTQKMMALLGLLALRRGRSVPREELAEALWPDQAPEWQKARLRNELAFLTQMLGDDAIVRHGRTALALAEHISCDVTDFDNAVRQAESAADANARLSYLRAAALLQAADFMPGFYEGPILEARERLRRDLYRVLRRLRDAYYAQGRTVEAERSHAMLAARFPDEEIPAPPQGAPDAQNGRNGPTTGESDYPMSREREAENLRGALNWLEENDPKALVQVVITLFPYWESRGLLAEGAERSGRAAALSSDPSRTAMLLVNRTRFLFYLSDFAAAEAAGREALEHARQAGDPVAEARARRYLGEVLLYRGDAARAGELLRAARQGFQETGDRNGECGALLTLGLVHDAVMDYATGRGYFEECYALARELGDRFTALISRFYIGNSYNCEENYAASGLCFATVLDEAERHGERMPLAYARWGEGVRLISIGRLNEGEDFLCDAARTCAAIRHRWGVSLTWEALSYVACERGQNERGTRLMGAADRLRRELRFPLPPSYLARHERCRDRLRKRLGEKGFASLWEDGASLSDEDAQALALGECP